MGTEVTVPFIAVTAQLPSWTSVTPDLAHKPPPNTATSGLGFQHVKRAHTFIV